MTARKLAKRIEFWQKELKHLGLGHWRIDAVGIVDEIPDTPGLSVACVQTSQQYDNFRIWFQTEYVEQATPEDIDETIIHELLHVSMRGIDRTFDAVESWMPQSTYGDFMRNVMLEREAFIERLARTIYQVHSGNGDASWQQAAPR